MQNKSITDTRRPSSLEFSGNIMLGQLQDIILDLKIIIIIRI